MNAHRDFRIGMHHRFAYPTEASDQRTAELTLKGAARAGVWSVKLANLDWGRQGENRGFQGRR